MYPRCVCMFCTVCYQKCQIELLEIGNIYICLWWLQGKERKLVVNCYVQPYCNMLLKFQSCIQKRPLAPQISIFIDSQLDPSLLHLLGISFQFGVESLKFRFSIIQYVYYMNHAEANDLPLLKNLLFSFHNQLRQKLQSWQP